MTLPNFLNIGTMKGGTTSLFRYLDAHPDVYMPSAKELHYFVAERNWGRGLAWYEDQFRDAGGRPAVGEASPSYTNHPQWQGVPERIKSVLGDVRLIYVLRDPLERMKSHYRHEVIMGREHQAPDAALRTDTPYFHRSCYALQLERYLEHFERDRILLVTSEDLKSKRDETVAKVLGFLDLEPIVAPRATAGEFHRSSDKGRRSNTLRSLAKLPAYERISRAVPEGVKSRLRGLGYRRVEVGDVELAPHKEHELREALAPDVAKLRGYMPADFTGWGFP
ncbi:MAG: sulfotransferase family protein [Actinomycetota bacterium]